MLSRCTLAAKFIRFALVVLALLGGASFRAQALQGETRLHDPATIIKQGNTYWTFATGDGISSLYSTDLVQWTAGPRVFLNNTYPTWINTKVPDFRGTFWAPECFFMNGKYYLYYSCSTFGSRISAIGLATNPTLDPTSPDYRWTDQGEVISTGSGNNATEPNAIDPAIFRDANNRLWMTYGSFFGGIRTTELDPATGKLLGTTQYAVGNNGAEAAFVKQRGDYYYLFLNRGNCCQGISSTYFILVGRSLSPTGPFLDQQGVDLNNGGGTTVLSSSGRYRGPGHAGILEEGGESYFSHHYYDSFDRGTAKLGLAKLTWNAAGWPVVSRDWVPNLVATTRYTIATSPVAGSLVWQSKDCIDAAGQGITQGARTGSSCQQWNFTALGNGDYKITNALGGLTASVAGCSDANSAPLQLSAYTEDECQKFHIDRANDGGLVFSSLNGNRVVEVPFASTTPGTQLALFDYNGCACQRWFVTPASNPMATAGAKALAGVGIYPVPASRSGFTLDLSALKLMQAVGVEVFDLQGRPVFRQEFARPPVQLLVKAALTPGLYLVRVQQGANQTTQRITVL